MSAMLAPLITVMKSLSRIIDNPQVFELLLKQAASIVFVHCFLVLISGSALAASLGASESTGKRTVCGSNDSTLTEPASTSERNNSNIEKILERASGGAFATATSLDSHISEGVKERFSNFPYDHNVLSDECQALIRAADADLKEIACGLVERKRKFILRWEAPQKVNCDSIFPTSVNMLELLCFMPEQYIESVLRSGQKNVHQVGHTRGLCEKEVRAKAEDFMVGIHLEDKYDPSQGSAMHQLRPKYGFVNFFAPCGVRMNPFRLFQYGQVILVYRDSVKDRTTYTFGDSLASYCEPLSMTMNPLDPIPLRLLRAPSTVEKNCRYVEAQIWGPIDVSDIKELRVPRTRTDLAEKLSMCGLPVFSYDRQKIEESDEYTDVSACGWQRGEPLNALAIELVKKEKLAQK